MKKLFAHLLVVAMLLCTFAGCAPKSKPAQDADKGTSTETVSNDGPTTFGIEPMAEPITLEIGYFSGSMHGLPFYIMDEKGWIEEIGVSFNYQSFIAGPAMMEANADWDLATTGGPGALSGILGYDITVIGIPDLESILNLYVREDSPIYQAGKGNFPEYPEMYGTVDTWKNTEWLIPVGSTVHQTLITVLEQIGLSAADVTMTNMDAPTALTAYKTGAGDGLAVWTSTALDAEEFGLIKAAGAGPNDNNVIVPSTIVATNVALEDPAKYEAICKVWEIYFRTFDYIQENLEECAQLYLDTCEIEGIYTEDDYELCHECLVRFNPYGFVEELELMNTFLDDPTGLASRQISMGEDNLFEILDFFISQDKYTSEDRTDIVDNKKVISDVAKAVAERVASR